MRAYERLIRYAKVYTTSDDSFDCCPSTERQLVLAKMLAEELKELGVSDARVDENGYVYGVIPPRPVMRPSPPSVSSPTWIRRPMPAAKTSSL